MFGYSKEKFEGFVTKIKDDWAHVTVVDSKSKKSYMSVPIEDLKNRNIECKVGVIFSIVLVLKPWLKREKFVFSPIKRKHISTKEFDALLKYYEEKYRDV